MKILKKLSKKYDHFCIALWIKYYIHLEGVRLKAEAWTYKMDNKLKDR